MSTAQRCVASRPSQCPLEGSVVGSKPRSPSLYSFPIGKADAKLNYARVTNNAQTMPRIRQSPFVCSLVVVVVVAVAAVVLTAEIHRSPSSATATVQHLVSIRNKHLSTCRSIAVLITGDMSLLGGAPYRVIFVPVPAMLVLGSFHPYALDRAETLCALISTNLFILAHTRSSSDALGSPQCFSSDSSKNNYL